MSRISSLQTATASSLGLATVIGIVVAHVLPTKPPQFDRASTPSIELRAMTEDAEPINYTALAAIAVVGAGAVAIGISAKQALQTGASSAPTHSLPRSTARLDQANRKLQRRLLNLLHDDRQAADRLLAQVKLRHPDRPTDWCVEKVIYDLERDRGH